jgi:cyanophycinase-like exopeptidase
MAAMSPQHRVVLNQVSGTPRPVFLDTTAGYETNVDAIVTKAVEYYEHHLQLRLRVARYRHRDRTTTADIAAAVAEIRGANLIFAGPGSPSYAIRQWRGSPVWAAVEEQFEAGADVMFASAASITIGKYALPVYEIYKAGEDPFWNEGLDLLGKLGLSLAVVPHFDDNSGGENYDSRFCYMGAGRFDRLQELLPPDVSILGIDAYTAISFDPDTREASVSGQGGVTLIADGFEQRFKAGSRVAFSDFHSSTRGVVHLDDGARVYGYEFSDTESSPEIDPIAALTEYIETLDSLQVADKVELLARLQSVSQQGVSAPQNEDALIDLVLVLREELRSAKRFEPADRARKALEAMGLEIGDSPEGAQWTRR